MCIDIEELQDQIDDLENEIQESLWTVSNPGIGISIDDAIAQTKSLVEQYCELSRQLRTLKSM